MLRGGDPRGLYLEVTVDLEDSEKALDPVRGRLLEMQVDERLPVYVLTAQPLSRILADRERMRREAMSMRPSGDAPE